MCIRRFNKVITRDDSTNIEYFVHETEGEFTTYSKFIDKGGSCFEIEANKPIYWKSDKPILVNQLMMHKGIVNDTIQESLYYDPSLVTLAPIEQFIESVTFATQEIIEYLINISLIVLLLFLIPME